MMAGEITFVPTQEDYAAVARGSFRAGLRRPRFHVRLLLALLVGALIGAGVSWLEKGSVVAEAVVWAIVAMLVWLIIWLTVLYPLIPRRSARLFRQQRSLAGSFTTSWDAAGLTQVWEHGRSHHPWRDYHGRFETDRVFAFGLNEQLYHFVPKRVMSAEQMAGLREAAAAIAGSARRA